MARLGQGDFLGKTKIDGECMLWTGATNGMGIGVLRRSGKNHKAHRFAWEMIHGPLREDQWLLRTCQTHGCINPGHMLLKDVELTEAQRRARHYKGCPGTRPITPAEVRFDAMTCEGPTVVPELGPCLGWTGGLTTARYGSFSMRGQGCIPASRAAWMIKVGPIPEGMDVLHRCDNRVCTRISHLFLGTHLDNMDDMLAKRRRVSKLTPEDVVAIRADNRKSKVIAKERGVCYHTVHNIKSGVTWYYVRDDGTIDASAAVARRQAEGACS